MDGQQQFADAMRAFDAYYGTRRASYGIDWPAKRYAEHRSWKTFMKVAAYCAKNNLDVERYVTVVLEHLPKGGQEVMPTDLLTDQGKNIWSVHKSDKAVDAAGKWAYFTRLVIQIQQTTGMDDESILIQSLNSQFPAWFRVMYPEHVSDIMVEAWGEDAVSELKEDRDTVRFLRAAMASKMEEFEKKVGVIDGL